ncbi:TPA: hypothetical protein IZ487_001002 [Enterococcus faecium]|nr:hypothetical protein [Enterococcus raffinosus]HAQ3886344.1 hypothetical protein [Enterococcus faecium]HDU2614758.1 hypothetical protein [Enterococcus faecalis]HAR1779703.1 hypothetical protein [Enterococcus faecium]HBC2647252.1 hypothetical protein [Enterococcus faecium]HBC2768536.1 hypothetical protein [Enterococcus faecium]
MLIALFEYWLNKRNKK